MVIATILFLLRYIFNKLLEKLKYNIYIEKHIININLNDLSQDE